MIANLIPEAEAEMRSSRAYEHPLLEALRSVPVSPERAERFAVQWYKAATAHKKAFPGLIYNMEDDEVRLGLIDILDEEYGYGELDNVHARLLGRFVAALGLDQSAVDSAERTAGVERFATEVDELWLRADPRVAYGVHFALEYLAANMHKAFYAGVSRLGLPDEAVIYFKLHSTVEEEHAAKAQTGLLKLAVDPQAEAELMDGIRKGTELVEALLDGLEEAYRGPMH
jgi:pyrroloquinoline quinone (PQQ) biosynthesis protein C